MILSSMSNDWALFFVQVVENIARKNGINKSELLDREADDLAVRIALGETHVIAETKKFLSRSGVNVAALEEHASKRNEKFKRSNYVILVKNLPFNSTDEELATLFQKHGSLDKIILPPTRVFALVCQYIKLVLSSYFYILQQLMFLLHLTFFKTSVTCHLECLNCTNIAT